MRVLPWLALIFVCLGAFVWDQSQLLFSDARWHPVMGPVPGPGLSVVYPFSVQHTGTYALELQVPATPRQTATMPAIAPLETGLRVNISNSRGFDKNTDVSLLRHSGGYPFGHLDYFKGGDFLLPEGDGYVVTITATDMPQSWVSSGAVFSLALNENPTTAAGGKSDLSDRGLCALLRRDHRMGGSRGRNAASIAYP